MERERIGVIEIDEGEIGFGNRNKGNRNRILRERGRR